MNRDELARLFYVHPDQADPECVAEMTDGELEGLRADAPAAASEWDSGQVLDGIREYCYKLADRKLADGQADR
jgi:hypothetical protein